jgi:hypothetical protein
MNETARKANMNYANHLGYSDVNPYEVVARISDKTLEVREMSATLDPNWQPEFLPGGFAGHCVNQGQQRWKIASDPAQPVIRIRLNKRGLWRSSDGRRFQISDRPVKFYDYNF